MSELRYSKDHEWVRLDGDEATVGVTDYAQQQLGDLVFVELPEVGRTVKAGDEIAVVESVKAASDVYAPIEGEVAAVNEALEDDPGLINREPVGDGWLFRVKPADPAAIDALMDAHAYQAFVDSLDD